MAEIKYSTLKIEDANTIVPYLQRVLSHAVNKESFIWEFFDNLSVLTIATEGQKIVGTQSFLFIRILVKNEEVLSSKSETSYLDSDFRGQKIFESLYEFGLDQCKNQHVQFVWGFTPAAKVWKNNLNFDIVSQCMDETYYENTDYIDYNLIKKFSSNSLTYHLKVLKAKLTNIQRRLKEYQLFKLSDERLVKSEILSDDMDFSELYTKMKVKFKFSVHLSMTAAYYNWRVINNPNVKYENYFYHQDQKMVGYLVFTHSNDTLYLSDISYYSETTLIKMVSDLKKYMKLKNLKKIYYFGNKLNNLNKMTFTFLEKLGSRTGVCAWANFVLKDISDNKKFGDLKTEDIYINGLWTEGFKM
ncbi:MAG: hypothetical protein H0W73_00060 [Bacteroidetes bacterium]|nr:hypothetical protein [Bacteroidota bacterium]